MADREAVRQIIEGAYAARGKGDVAGVMAHFHTDASFELVGDTKLLSVAGASRGGTALGNCRVTCRSRSPPLSRTASWAELCASPALV